MSDAPSGPIRLASAAVVLAGTATIAGAWIFQYLGYVPCPLCLQQRVPYYLAIPIAFAAFVLAGRAPATPWPRLLIGIVGVFFLVGALLGAYHAGIEWKWWAGPTDCAAGAGAGVDAGNLLDSLNETILVRCDEAAWRLVGISLAGWNVVISATLAAVSLGAAARR